MNDGGLNNSGIVEVTGTGGTVTFNASFQSGASTGRSGLYLTGSTTVTVNGNCTGGAGSGQGCAIASPGGAKVTVNGTVAGGTTGAGLATAVACEITVNGTIRSGSGLAAYGISINTTVAARLRLNALIDHTTGVSPITSTVPVQFIRDGANLAVTGPSADNWPLPTGAPITLTAAAAGPDVPEWGQLWPRGNYVQG